MEQGYRQHAWYLHLRAKSNTDICQRLIEWYVLFFRHHLATHDTFTMPSKMKALTNFVLPQELIMQLVVTHLRIFILNISLFLLSFSVADAYDPRWLAGCCASWVCMLNIQRKCLKSRHASHKQVVALCQHSDYENENNVNGYIQHWDVSAGVVERSCDPLFKYYTGWLQLLLQFYLSKCNFHEHPFSHSIWKKNETQPWLIFTQRIFKKGVLYPHRRRITTTL